MDRPNAGFLTREIRRKGRRVGFSIHTLDGRKGILAHVDIESSLRVGRYGVNLQDIDHVAVPAMTCRDDSDIIVIDEIGKMECFSATFRETLLDVLDSANSVIGSIALKGDGFISGIKKRTDTQLISVSDKNRELHR